MAKMTIEIIRLIANVGCARGNALKSVWSNLAGVSQELDHETY